MEDNMDNSDCTFMLESLYDEYEKRFLSQVERLKKADLSNPTEGNQYYGGTVDGFFYAIEFLQDLLIKECFIPKKVIGS